MALLGFKESEYSLNVNAVFPDEAFWSQLARIAPLEVMSHGVVR
jgi:hypothetical protein